jgi:hypothetical protein
MTEPSDQIPAVLNPAEPAVLMPCLMATWFHR